MITSTRLSNRWMGRSKQRPFAGKPVSVVSARPSGWASFPLAFRSPATFPRRIPSLARRIILLFFVDVGFSHLMKLASGRGPRNRVGRTHPTYGRRPWPNAKKDGCLPLFSLGESGRPKDLRSNGFNIAFRFGVEQADKLRACDDIKHSLTNSACRVHTPIKLVSWGRVSKLCRSYSVDGRDWALFKSDHEAAYKRLPIDPGDQSYAIIALRRQASGKWNGFRPTGLMFGIVAGVLHYDVFSRLITDIFNRLFGIPPICFFGDFAALTHRLLATKGMSVISRFCSLIGAKLKGDKSDVGPDVAFLGLLSSFPSKGNGSVLSISLPGGKRKARSTLIRPYFTQNRLSYQELEKLIGRLSFSQTLLFGEFARTQPRPPLREAS